MMRLVILRIAACAALAAHFCILDDGSIVDAFGSHGTA
jgi:hypothetical protein